MARAALQVFIDPCIACHRTVHSCQEALKCKVCGFWQHILISGTGISHSTYYSRAVRLRDDIPLACDGCQIQSVDMSIVSFSNIQLPVLNMCGRLY